MHVSPLPYMNFLSQQNCTSEYHALSLASSTSQGCQSLELRCLLWAALHLQVRHALSVLRLLYSLHCYSVGATQH